MAEVVSVCEKCKKFVLSGLNVSASGMVNVSPEWTNKHWEASPSCRGSDCLIHLDNLLAAAALARKVDKNPGWRPSRWRLFRARALTVLTIWRGRLQRRISA